MSVNFRRVINRLKEPSTYAGLAGLFLVLGVTHEQFALYSTAAAGIAGFIAMLLPEKDRGE